MQFPDFFLSENTAVKYCGGCDEQKPVKDFSKSKATRDGLLDRCKPCSRANSDRWRKSERGIAWMKRNRFRIAVGQAKSRSISWEISEREFFEAISKPCTYCGTKLGDSGCCLDRLDPDRGYALDNVTPCCKWCNLVRSRTFTVSEMTEILGPAIREVRNRRQK